ncbi:hypothetical protein [Variovorax guangxiensis]|uniref:hypothetical protein n=1 Tax=Variovorax guangxiensis TaxID=1775474 RepID=UPI0014050662|nr:hypothetical protein [Variovorax guangxiensis]
MNQSENVRFEPVSNLPSASDVVAKDLASRRISFMLPEELEMIGGGVVLQFAYDFPEGYA